VFSVRLAVVNRGNKSIFIPRYKKRLSCEHSKKYLNVAMDNIFNESFKCVEKGLKALRFTLHLITKVGLQAAAKYMTKHSVTAR
jgi:hypothetical protein